LVISVNPIYNTNRFVLQECEDFTWRVARLWRISGGYSQW